MMKKNHRTGSVFGKAVADYFAWKRAKVNKIAEAVCLS